MELNLLAASVSGIIAGLVHVFSGPDHLAAILPLTADQPSRHWRVGLWWGMGHTGSVWAMGVAFWLMREALPLEQLSSWGEWIVGIVLIVLGFWGFQKAIRSSFHLQRRTVESGVVVEGRDHAHASLNIGLLHGFAGSSHLIALMPALMLPGAVAAAAYIVFFGIGTILAMAGFSCLVGVYLERFMVKFSKGYLWSCCAFSFFAVGTGCYWLISN